MTTALRARLEGSLTMELRGQGQGGRPGSGCAALMGGLGYHEWELSRPHVTKVGC